MVLTTSYNVWSSPIKPLSVIQASNAAELDQGPVVADPQEKELMFLFSLHSTEAISVLHSTSSSLLIDIQAMYVCAWS